MGKRELNKRLKEHKLFSRFMLCLGQDYSEYHHPRTALKGYYGRLSDSSYQLLENYIKHWVSYGGVKLI